MPAAFVDTGYIIGLFRRDDRYHANCARWAERLRRERWILVTTAAIIAEIGDEFRSNWPLIRRFMIALRTDPSIDIVAVTPDLACEAIQLRDSRRDKDWGLTDCISFVVMQQRGLTDALSADRHFQQAGFRALLLEPT
jgi:uncharacterized protein